MLPAVMLAIAFTTAAAVGQTVELVPEPRVAAHADAVDQAREQVRAWFAENNLAGASVAVGLDGELVWAEGFDWADLEQGVPVTPVTRLRVGSISKPLTSVAVGLLHGRGRLDLDAPVQRYVPDFPDKPWPITTRQLMGHVAGIRHYRSSEEVLSSEHYDNVLESIGIFADDPLLFEPGTASEYSSYGWNLVSAVVEGASGEPFLDFMRREVFAPLGMRRTVPDDVFRIVPDRASFYARDPEGRLRNERHVDQSNKWAGGGFLSTPSDLVRFGFAMLDGALLGPDMVELLWTPIVLESGEIPGYGLGWSINQMGGRRVVGHGGSSVAGNLYYVGSTGVTAFLLTGPDGHVLIDGGYRETAPLIIESITKLGFDITDVEVLLNSHAHADHAGGLRDLQRASGAELWISEGDADLIAACRSSMATIRVGPIELTAHVTASHTPGCTSWSFPVLDGDRELLAVSICSLTLLPFMSLTDAELRADFEHSFETLRSLPAEIFLASRGSFFELPRKVRERADAEDPVAPFIDPAGYLGFIDRAENRFREALAKQEGRR